LANRVIQNEARDDEGVAGQAVHARHVGDAEAAVRRVEVETVDAEGAGGEAGQQAHLIEDVQGARADAVAAGFVAGEGCLVNEGHVEAAASEEVGRRRPRRPRADNGDVVLVLSHGLFTAKARRTLSLSKISLRSSRLVYWYHSPKALG
jgi:hypothetical protein